MFGPSTIELRRLFVGEHKVLLTFLVGKALPENHRKFGPIARRKLQELSKRAGFHRVQIHNVSGTGNILSLRPHELPA